MEKKLDHIGLRLDDQLMREAKAIAASNDMGLSEWIRLLMVSAVENERRKYADLHSIFGQDKE